MNWYILSPDGAVQGPVDMETYARWAGEDEQRKRVDRTEVGDVEVSTVFLGLDHNHARIYGGDLTPVLFETMTFGGGKDTDERQWRYHTKAEAQAGHDRVVAALRAGRPLDDIDGAA